MMAGMCATHVPAVHAAERPGEVLRNALDPSRAGIHLGWRPFTPLESGIAAVFEHSAREPQPPPRPM